MMQFHDGIVGKLKSFVLCFEGINTSIAYISAQSVEGN